MSRLAPHRLTARQVATHKEGDLADGGNLWLVVRGASRIWTFRYKSPVTDKRREMSLGSAYDVSLAEARTIAAESRRLVNQRIDPLEQRRSDDADRKHETTISLRAVAQSYIESQKPGWRDPRAASVWTSSLEQYVYPTCGEKPVKLIDTADIEAVLKPIWTEKTETATRVRGRVERILDYARAQGWRTGENPARWKGHLSAILAPPSKVMKSGHFAAVDRKDISHVMAALAESQGVAAKAVRFTCLTAARSGEVRNATWSEIDLNARVWTIPAHRMKMGKEHRVPLSDGAVAVLQEVMPLRDERAGDLVFPGQKRGKPLSDVALSKALHIAAGTKDVTVHGLRSTFRDWAAEGTDYPSEVAEMALAHAISNKVEAAYRRGDLFEKRREMMAGWNGWCQDFR
ncbi:phage integrase [Acetobacter aceti NRIC 0242]|uniref:Phage integrase n=1 Tax=Acetobacter aceti NBRC 14818 TaxID=887700 RepID=A0AB33IEX5_ACEAC|nr:tyrosine-type recombinase/integrase [Acetobacter aceti]TCS33044.1 integrase [Acetobacter aceti NBRC 14818]BCK76477.1 phage integrase [Acetobacter aceti NBRC 14818]GAN56217.1 phage integrase [Acetobacter aceti NBRC 14818]GBO81610.1 phage integrase [Acetobacter aceti NRIC 0242]